MTPFFRNLALFSRPSLPYWYLVLATGVFFVFGLPAVELSAVGLFVLSVNTVLLIVIFLAVQAFTRGDILTALPVTIATALSPTLLGITRLAEPHSLLWSFGAAAVFSFLAFLETGRRRFLGMTIVLSGGAVLARPDAVVLFPLLFATLAGKYLFHHDLIQADESGTLFLRRALGGLATVIIGSLLLFALFSPFLSDTPPDFWDSTVGFLRDQNLFAPLSFAFVLLFIDAFLLQTRFVKHFARALSPVLPATRFLLLLPLVFFVSPFIPGLTGPIPGGATFLLRSTPPLMLGFLLLLFVQTLRTRQHPRLFEILFFSLVITGSLIGRSSGATPENSPTLVLLFPFLSFLIGLGLRELVLLIPKPSRARMFPFIPPIIIALGALTFFLALPDLLSYANPLLCS